MSNRKRYYPRYILKARATPEPYSFDVYEPNGLIDKIFHSKLLPLSKERIDMNRGYNFRYSEEYKQLLRTVKKPSI